MNILTKTSLGINHETFKILNEFKNSDIESLSQKYINDEFKIFETNTFSNYDGLMADPTRIKRNNEPVPKFVKLKELINELKLNFILIDDQSKYNDYFQLKKSILDKNHFGNFHQQLGQYLMLEKRESPSTWWLSQKFDVENYKIKNNLYKSVQENFLKKYFSTKFSKNDFILDIGCGPGYYTNLIGLTGAKVLGIDPSDEYINLAKKHANENTTFEKRLIGEKGNLDSIPDNSADFVFMSDALLFYFVPFSNEKPDISILFDDIKRILKPNGTFISLEPHYIFWLLPWLGDEKNPFTILTEYNGKKFGVTPTLSELIQSYNEYGFAVSWMEEIYPDIKFKNEDPRAYYFGSKFPLWHLFELKSI
jgi:SAM-dependent methyltransferase